eukprot:superscaffoldBa00001753_g11878
MQTTLVDYGQCITSPETSAVSDDQRIRTLEARVEALDDSNIKLLAKTSDLESRSRRNNIRIFEDYAPEVAEERAKYRTVMAELYNLSLRPTLLFPVRLQNRPDTLSAIHGNMTGSLDGETTRGQMGSLYEHGDKAGCLLVHQLEARQASNQIIQIRDESGHVLGIVGPRAVLPSLCSSLIPLLRPVPCAPSHPTMACTLSAPLPCTSVAEKQNPPPITPKPAIAQLSTLGPLPKGVDKRGTPILYQGGRMICNNYNDLGCSVFSCRFMDTCSFCSGAHARSTCPRNPSKQHLCKYLDTPIDIDALVNTLQDHPNHQIIDFLIQGFTHGFHLDLQVMPDSTHICHNLQLALSDPATVDKLLQKEVDATFMIGPFSSMSLYGSTIPSINSPIPSPDFSMQYATIDHTISLISLAGQGDWLFKVDITSTFKVLPIHTDYWYLFGVFWKG